MLTEEIQYKLLYRLLSEKKWKDLSPAAFSERYEEEVGDLTADIQAVHVTDDFTAYELTDGLVAVEAGNKWSLFETELRARTRDHFKAWNEFARGYWSANVPQKAGLYFVKDLDLGKRSVRELKVINGRLRDVSGGAVRPGRVSEWVGYWYLPQIPPLPGSY